VWLASQYLRQGFIMFFRRFTLIVAVFMSLALGAPLLGHEGHDHDSVPVSPAQTNAARLEASSAAFELLAVRQNGELTIWLDRFETNEPVTNAAIEVETPVGPQTASPSADGVYRLAAPWAEKSGSYDLIFTVVAGGNVDILTGMLRTPEPVPAPKALRPPQTGYAILAAGLGGLTLGAFFAIFLRRRPLVLAPALGLLALAAFGAARLFAHEGYDHGGEAVVLLPEAPDRAQALPDGSVFLPKATQRVLFVRTALGRDETFAKRVELPGRVIPDPNGAGLVQASAVGRLSPPPGGFPSLGTKVHTGEVLAYVSTPFLAIDQSTMHQQQGDLDQQISIIERRISRYETLAKTGAVAAVTLDEARLELEGLRNKRASLDRAKREPEALRAPIDGLIATANAVAGQVVDVNAIIFQIIDPKRLFVEALSFDSATPADSASARSPDGHELELAFIGAGLADRNQAAALQFAIKGAPTGLRPGQFITVLAQTGAVLSGLAASRASVVRRSNGENVVYTHDAAERFRSVVVRTQPLDAERVLIVSGLEPGKRIVTQAAELLNQVR
jgi:hypothetical protein